MKILKSLIILITIVSLISCGQEELKCDNITAKRTIKELFEEEMNKDIDKLKLVLNIDEEYLKHFFSKNIKLTSIRTKEKNKELKSCQCSANVKLELNQNITDYLLKKAENKEITKSKNQINNMLNQRVNIDYSIQETSDGEIYVETIMPHEMGDLLGTGYNFEKFYKENNLILENNKEYKFGYFTEDCSYTLSFMIKDNKKINGTVNQKCIGNNGAGIRNFTGKFKDGKIIAKVEDAESFELTFIDKIMKYTLTKSVMQNGKEITYSDETRSKMTIDYELLE